MGGRELPTWDEMLRQALTSLDGARNGLSGARDWLASDWRTPPPGDAAAVRAPVRERIAEAKRLIDEAKGLLWEARGE